MDDCFAGPRGQKAGRHPSVRDQDVGRADARSKSGVVSPRLNLPETSAPRPPPPGAQRSGVDGEGLEIVAWGEAPGLRKPPSPVTPHPRPWVARNRASRPPYRGVTTGVLGGPMVLANDKSRHGSRDPSASTGGWCLRFTQPPESAGGLRQTPGLCPAKPEENRSPQTSRWTKRSELRVAYGDPPGYLQQESTCA